MIQGGGALEEEAATFHIQIFDVSRDCVENNFLDFYSELDTHVYNLRDIKRNDKTPNTVILPDGAYGFFIVNNTDISGNNISDKVLIGNMRIVDNSGYEYRTNMIGPENNRHFRVQGGRPNAYFNFNTSGDVTLSDIIGFQTDINDDLHHMSNIRDTYATWKVEIVGLNEDVSSCRNITYACTNQDNPLLPILLERLADKGNKEASQVASVEYGINEAIPSSKDAPLLCPGNTVSQGWVRLQLEEDGDNVDRPKTLFIGLNNGNGRGSMDVFQADTCLDAGDHDRNCLREGE